MARAAVLVTGANGEIGRALLDKLAENGGRDVVTLDLTPLSGGPRPNAIESYAGTIVDRHLLDQLAAHHEIDQIFHLAALLSTRGEWDPDLSHQVNVEGTLNVLRMAQNQSSRLGRPVQVIFPSSIAVYGLPSLDEKRSIGRVREEQWNAPITMYGCNKLYCEHLGRYFTLFAQNLRGAAGAARLDFRALRFPGIISADSVPTGGTSDFAPEMLHAAGRGEPYACFVDQDAQIPFMAMPDAVRALFELSCADRARLTTCVYNVGAFALSAGAIAKRVCAAFPGATIRFDPDVARAKIVASWPYDLDDTRARLDWGWQAEYDWNRAMDEVLIPTVRARYGRR